MTKIKTIDDYIEEIFKLGFVHALSEALIKDTKPEVRVILESLVDSAPDGKHEKVLPNSFEAGHNLHCEYIKHWKKQMRGNNE